MTKTAEEIDYDQFLERWEGSRHVEHASLDSNLFDPFAQARLLADWSEASEVPRSVRVAAAYNAMSAEEEAVRHLDFFREHQPIWAADFRERLLARIEQPRVDIFLRAMVEHWIDGARRRQDAPEMQAIKTSIGRHDLYFEALSAGKYVIKPYDNSVDPLFDPDEMRHIFEVNEGMLNYAMPAYLSEMFGERVGSINWLYVRRGVCMPHEPKSVLEELNYLTSYSLASGPVELFAQTQGRKACDGLPCIIAGRLPAVQKRVVAFAPFIAKFTPVCEGMQVDQMEFVLAPPLEPIAITFRGKFGPAEARIGEYDFD